MVLEREQHLVRGAGVRVPERKPGPKSLNVRSGWKLDRMRPSAADHCTEPNVPTHESYSTNYSAPKAYEPAQIVDLAARHSSEARSLYVSLHSSDEMK